MSGQARLVIIGAGPAGLAAAIQAGRDGHQPLLLCDGEPGGLVRSAYRLDNLPGFPEGISGPQLADRLLSQALRFGVTPRRVHVTRLRRIETGFLLHTVDASKNEHDIEAAAVIVATGTRADPYVWEPPAPLAGRLHRDSRSLPDDLRGLAVAVIGGGEAALDLALSAARRGASTDVYARGERFKAPERLIEEARAAGIALHTLARVVVLSCDRATLRLDISGALEPERCVAADHLVVAIGRRPQDDLLESFPKSVRKTSSIEVAVPGLFLAGDLIHDEDRFAAIAMGDGVQAARLAGAYLRQLGDSTHCRHSNMERS